MHQKILKNWGIHFSKVGSSTCLWPVQLAALTIFLLPSVKVPLFVFINKHDFSLRPKNMKFSKFGGKWNPILHRWFGHGNMVENRQNEKQDRMAGWWSSAGKWKAILYHLAAKSRCHRLTSATHVVQIPQTLERRSEKCLWYHKTLNAGPMKQMLKYHIISRVK